MRPVRNVLPRIPRDEEESAIARPRVKKATMKARSAQTAAVPRLARGAGKGTAEAGARGSSLQPVRRKRPAPVDADSDAEGAETTEGPATLTSANHNKYCHFCQHVKVRASSMLACQNQECCRRFCEHCLITHLSEDVDPMSSCAWTVLDGKPVWHCPICRKKCCCSQADCKQDHRHCKAYRYRRRRAELATKRMSASSALVAGEKRVKKSAAAKDAVAKAKQLAGAAAGSPGAGPIMRPGLTFGFVRSSSTGSIDSPPCHISGSSTPHAFGSPTNSGRPRREATLRARNYALCDDDDEDEHDEEEDALCGGGDGCGDISEVEHMGSMQDGEEEDDGCCDGVSTPAAGEPHDDLLDCAGGGEPRPRCSDATAASHGPVCDPQDHMTGDLWTVGSEAAATAGGYAEDEVEDDQSESMADDVLGGIYGHMSQSSRCGDPYAACGGDYEIGDELGGGMDGCCGGGAEMDEARWIRRTYETVYNPAARQKALQALTSDLNLGGPRGGFALPPPGRYPLDEGELFFLSSSRPLGTSTPAAPPAAKKQHPEGGMGGTDGSDLFYFLHSQSSSKLAAGRGEAGLSMDQPAVRKCTVMYDFQ